MSDEGAGWRILRWAVGLQFVGSGWLVLSSGAGGLSSLVRGVDILAPLQGFEGVLLILLGLGLLYRFNAFLLAAGLIWVLADSLVGVSAGSVPLQAVASRAVRFAAPLALLYQASVSDPGRARPSGERSHDWLRVALAATFASHGISALLGKPGFVALIAESGEVLLNATIQAQAAREALIVIGSLDILVAFLLLAKKWTIVPTYMALWATITALSRVTAFGWAGLPETLLRACNVAVPVAIALWGLESSKVAIRSPAFSLRRHVGRAASLFGVLIVVAVPSFAAPSPRETAADPALGQPLVVNVLPEEGATVASRANLCAQVTGGDENVTLTFYGRDLSVAPGEDFAFIALPDTQVYAQSYPAIFNAQTAWIVEQREALNIPFVSQLGDVVDTGLSEFEWVISDNAFKLLEDPATTGLPEGIPYGIAVGSHDQGHHGHGTASEPARTTVLYNQYFGLDRFANREYFGGSLDDNNDNSYQLFSASGMDFIILHLEYERDANHTDPVLQQQVIDWADDVLKAYPDRRAIVSSHFLLNWFDSSWTDQGELIYERLKHNPNLFLMLCAHLAGEPRRTDTFEGNTVHTLMSDYQFYNNGGDGYLRIYTFSPENDEIRATTYSPWLDEYRINSKDDFTVSYDMDGGRLFSVVGTTADVTPGDTACVEWTGRESATNYEWYVEATNATGTSRGAVGSFGSDGACASAADCDDQDSCTTSSCLDDACVFDPVADCCVADLDCEDGNPCTDDVCTAGTCSNAEHSRACSDGSACTGGDVCTEGACEGVVDLCDDGNACTLGSCFEDSCGQEYAPSSGCCSTDVQCHDADPCTIDTCDPSGGCVNAVDPACCTLTSQCDDQDACSVDTCSTTNKAAFRVNGIEHVSMKPKGFWPVDVTSAASVFTVELWFKWDGGGATTWTSEPDVGGLTAYPLISRGRDDVRHSTDERNLNYFLGIREDSHELIADFEEHSSGSAPGQNHPIVGSTAVSLDVWHHAAASYDGSCWQLYLDGVPQSDGSNCPGEPPNFDAFSGLNIGAAQNFEGWIEGHFRGLLDEVRVWNRARTPAEILESMHLQIENHEDLIGRWGLDEVEDLFVADSTGNGHLGVAVGGSWEMVDVLPLGGNVCSNVLLAPNAVTDLQLSETSGLLELRWSNPEPGMTFDLISGSFSGLWTAGATPVVECLVDETTATTYDDLRVPASNEGFFFLIRSVDGCGVGSYGNTSAGEIRQPQGGCP